jgi:two-component system, cell cycle response regulator
MKNDSSHKAPGPDTTEVMTSTDPLTASLRDSRKKRACLMVIYGEEVGRRYWLTKEVMVAGRDEGVDFCIKNNRMSRKHFAILHKKPKYYLKDLGSRNGTMINNKKATQEVEIKYGDKIQCGGTVLQFVSEASIEHQMVDRLQEESFRDGLTQVYNKKILPEIEKEIFERAKTDRTLLGVIMFDIDHFKKLNDTHGHLFGDDVLKTLAKAIQTSVVRTEDMLVRFGGEEFLIVVPHADEKTLKSVGERVRKAAADLTFDHKKQKVTFTVSVGVRSWDPKQDSSIQALSMLIDQADQALYESKDKGRNRVSIFKS